MPIGVIHACFAHCFDCVFWKYKRDRYRSGECKWVKKKQHLGTNRACKHFKDWDSV